MISPHSEIIDSYLDDFKRLGFSITVDEPYKRILKKNNWSLEFTTEKYYQPNLTLKIIDGSGKCYLLDWLWEMVDPVGAETQKTKVGVMKNPSLGQGKEESDLDVEKYLRLVVSGGHGFLAKDFNRMVNTFDEIKERYEDKEKKFLDGFGARL